MVWGEKAIQNELERILGFRPSRSTVRRWASRRGDGRLPVKRLSDSRLVCADVIELERWKRENVK